MLEQLNARLYLALCVVGFAFFLFVPLCVLLSIPLGLQLLLELSYLLWVEAHFLGCSYELGVEVFQIIFFFLLLFLSFSLALSFVLLPVPR